MNDVLWSDVRPGDLWVQQVADRTRHALVVSLVETTERGYDVVIIMIVTERSCSSAVTHVMKVPVSPTDDPVFPWGPVTHVRGKLSEYKRFDKLRPGDLFLWASDVKPDYGYTIGEKNAAYQLPVRALDRHVTASYLALASYETLTMYDHRMWSVYAWDYKNRRFTTLGTVIPCAMYTDVLVLSSPVG